MATGVASPVGPAVLPDLTHPMSLILLAGLLSFVVADVFHSSLCAPGRLDVGGVDMVERNRGRILLAVRMGLQCHDCHKHLKEWVFFFGTFSFWGMEREKKTKTIFHHFHPPVRQYQSL